ncbi:Phosphatidylinositol kinase, partial [Globisporangium splendens]
MQYKEREHVESLLAQLVKRLKTKDAVARQQFAKELYTFVATLSRQLTSETFTKVLQQLTPQLYALMQSSNELDQLGGLAAIDLLIDISNEDQVIRFANYLRNFLTQPNTSRAALIAASTALGHLASSNKTSGVSGTLVAAFVDFEVKRAFEWLQGERQEAIFSQRRLAACFVLRELARSAPTLFHVNLTTFFQSIWGAIRDTRVEIREAATEALSACLQLITRRQTRHRVQWYCKVYDQVFEGLNVGRTGVGSGVASGHSGASTLTITASSPASGTVTTSWECVHGSLLVIGELLQHTGGFMVPRFREVCDTVLLYKDAKEKLVNRTVCALLPQLAEFCSDAFIRHYLNVTLSHLMKRIATNTSSFERGIAFLSLGRLALAIGDHIIPQLPPIVKLVKEGLATYTRKKKSKNKMFCIETLTCVANLSRALGAKFEKYLFDDLLEIMMQGGLTDELIDALTEIVASIPSALPIVQERLLNEISIILRGVPFSQGSSLLSVGSGASGDGSSSGDAADQAHSEKSSTPVKQSAVQALFSSMKRGSMVLVGSTGFTSSSSFVDDDSLSGSAMNGLVSSNAIVHQSSGLLMKGDTGDEIDIILLSLRTLSYFDFSGNFCLLPFVRDCVALYLKNPDPRIRKQAVITCSKLLLPPGSPIAGMHGGNLSSSMFTSNGQGAAMSSPLQLPSQVRNGWSNVPKRGPSGRVIDQVLTQLLQVGISDMDVNVRKSVTDSLDERFDELMSQEAHLTMVFTSLNDENAEIREKAMQLLERLAPRNPAFVMPSLRRVLIQLLTELEHTSDMRMREESTRLLGYLIRGAQHLIDPYIVRILQVLLPKLVQGNATLAIAVLKTIGELALVSQNQIAAYEHYLFPLIINTLQDHSSIEKRQIALQTLGQLAGSTGCVIRPYLASPKLLEILLSLLQHTASTPWPLRREAMKTIGILGALDPYKYKLCISRASLQEANDAVSTSKAGAKDDKEGAENPRLEAVMDGSQPQYNYPKLELDLKALGVASDFSSFTMKNTGEVLDEKQQIELQLFTAAPIGTRRPDAGSTRAIAASNEAGSYAMSVSQSAGATASSASALGRNKTSAAMSVYGDDKFDFESTLLDSDMEPDPTELSPSSEAYFPTVAIHALLRILKEPSLSMHHHGVIQAIMFIFKSLSIQCVPFLKYILPPFLRSLSRCEPRLRESLFLQLTNLISIVNAHMKPFFPPIMALALRFWNSHLSQIIRLMEKISQAAPQEFRAEYFPKLLPKILEVLQPLPELFNIGGLQHGEGGDHTSGGGNMPGGGTVKNALSGSPLLDASGAMSASNLSHLGGGASHVGNDHAAHAQSISGGRVAGAAAGSDGLFLGGYDSGARGGLNSIDALKKLGGKTSSGGVVAAIQVQVVQSLIVFRDAVEDYVYLVVPALARLMENVETPLDVKIMAIYAFSRICIVSKFEHYAGARILQPFARVAKQISAKGSNFFSRAGSSSASNSSAIPIAAGLGNGAGGLPAVPATRAEATKFSEVMLFALCAMAYQLQHDILNFEPLVLQIIASLPSQHETSTEEITQLVYRALDTLRRGEALSISLLDDPVFLNSSVKTIFLEVQAATGGSGAGNTALGSASSSNVRLHVNQQNLRRAWEASQRSTKEDWIEWMRRFSIELLRESPSAALRSCCALAQAYNPLARALFNPAFVSCWNELYEQYQDYLVRALETAFQSDTIPAEILQTLLNLAEFMEHDVEALPIDIRELGELAQKCHAYAKALHYKELEFHTSPSTCIEALISINNQLGQPEAAVGILKYAQQHHKSVIQVKETWYEKLQDWKAALDLYDRKMAESEAQSSGAYSLDIQVCIGKMRCLEALGEWEELAALADKVWKHLHAQPPEPPQRRVTASASRLLPRANSGSSTASMQSSFHRASSFSGSTSSAPGSSTHLSLSMDDREENSLKRVAMMGARASWCLSQWDNMTQYITECTPAPTLSVASGSEESDTQLCLYRSVLAVHHGKFDEAAGLIDETRKALDTKLGALVGESYSRAYRSMITLQQLSELEEIITYKKLRMNVAKSEEAARYKRHMVRMWHARLSGCKRVVEVWQQILAVRSLIITPRDDIDTWLQFASLCRQSGNLPLSLKVFTNSLGVNISGSSTGGVNPTGGALTDMLSVSSSASLSSSSIPFGYGEKEHHRVAFAYLKHLWAVGEKKKALSELHQLVSKISSRHSRGMPGQFHGMSGMNGNGYSGMGSAASSFGNLVGANGEEELLVKCHLKMAEWQLEFHEQQLERVSIPSVLSSLKLCTELESRSYKAWHAWALMNFHVVEHFSQQSVPTLPQTYGFSAPITAPGAGPGGIGPYIAPAIQGFFRSIALGRSRWAANVQQDILRILTLWFAHGHRTDVINALDQGFKSVSIETWLIVIPQLIARIHTPCVQIQVQLRKLLCAVGSQHPHALIYPLSVALKSPLKVRQQAAQEIMKKMCENYEDLVGEALMVSHELIRVAILWNEMWHEGLEEASRLYFGERDVDGMVGVLQPLHQMMDNGPQTIREIGFQQAFGRELREAHEWLQRFLNNRNNESDLNRAWDLYYHVFRRINKQLPQLTQIELQYASPNLLKARNLQLAVPGTYRAGHSIVKIGSFLSTVQVITSKQRPRCITIVGSNGLEYMFLLKGHEDLRQDERVTQLFGLVNALLINDRNTSKKDLKIHRYPVIPLSHNAGIIGWMPHCDTLHQLIRDYREARKILLNIEHRLMLQMAPDYDALTLLQKVEVFEYALENTAGQDLYKVLWLKSENSEVWLDRRTNYTRSLAVMSMVGYILGLGDRHPSNLMLHRFTGTIVHIDFGDCFEVAMDREKYPEKIPFRLTRMLTNAMEVSGIEGNFRYSCESVMQVLRENQHSLMAMLEAFVDDPLIGWRLLAPANVSPSKAGGGPSTASSSLMASSQMRHNQQQQQQQYQQSQQQQQYQQSQQQQPNVRNHPRSESISIPDQPANAQLEPVERVYVKTPSVAPAPPPPPPPPQPSALPKPVAPPAPALTSQPVVSQAVAPPEQNREADGEEDLVYEHESSNSDVPDDEEEADSAAETDESDAYDDEQDEEDQNDGEEDEDDYEEEEDDEEEYTEYEEKEMARESLQQTRAMPPAAAATTASASQVPVRSTETLSPPVSVKSRGIVGSSVSRASNILKLPPRPSTSVASSRPMSVSKSIAFTRRIPPSLPRNGGDIAEEDDDEKLRQIDHETTNLHHTISSLATSVSNVGQGSLSRSFMQTRMEAVRAAENSTLNVSAAGPNATTNQPAARGVTPAGGLPPPPPPSAVVGAGVVRAKARRNSMSQQIPSNAAAPPATASNNIAITNAAQSQSSKPDLHTNRSHRERELVHMLGPEGTGAPREALNEKAVAVIRRVQAKLTGRDFEGEKEPLDVSAQVQRLINQAASHENLCQCYIGWCPFW